jgi:mercuric reductase
LVKLVSRLDVILSATNILKENVLAPEAGEMIQEAVMAIRHGITVDDIARAMHPYLTHAEGMKLAAQSLGKDVRRLSCCAA